MFLSICRSKFDDFTIYRLYSNFSFQYLVICKSVLSIEHAKMQTCVVLIYYAIKWILVLLSKSYLITLCQVFYFRFEVQAQVYFDTSSTPRDPLNSSMDSNFVMLSFSIISLLLSLFSCNYCLKIIILVKFYRKFSIFCLFSMIVSLPHVNCEA